MRPGTGLGLLLSASRSFRSFTFTVLAISAPYFLGSLGIGYLYTGIIVAFSGLTSTVFVYLIPKLRVSLKSRLEISWVLLVVALLVLYLQQNLYSYVAALLIGGVPLSGKDMSANQAMEQYAIGKTSQTQAEKNSLFSYYNFLSYAGNTAAAVVLWTLPGISFGSVFLVCLAMSLLSGIPYLALNFPAWESSPSPKSVSEGTKRIRNTLGVLFAVDAFAGGMINSAMLSLWFLAVYGLQLVQVGLIFVIVNALSAVSILIAGRVSTRIGLVRTMVFTHLVSNAFLILMPVIHVLVFSEAMLFARQATSQMDVSPRDSFINTFIPENDRMATNSEFISIRNAAIIPAPAAGGELAGIMPAAMPFLAGVIKAAYDLAFYARFHGYESAGNKP